jgi:diguanylate cyclase (GGDEF)-like protein/PAS domain S-box-containing protein/putative nucleotidyltransferase with HDIG domain
MAGHDLVFLVIDAYGGSPAINKWLETWFPDANIVKTSTVFQAVTLLSEQAVDVVVIGDMPDEASVREEKTLTALPLAFWSEGAEKNALLQTLVKARSNYCDNSEDVVDSQLEKYAKIMDDLPSLVCEFTAEGILTYVNKSFSLCQKKSRDELIGKPIAGFILPENREARISAYESLKPLRRTCRGIYGMDCNGEKRWYECQDRAIYDSRGKLLWIYSVGSDVTEKEQLGEQLCFSEIHDGLTQVYNREHFWKYQQKLDKKSDYPLTVVTADINGLKLVNDSFGHTAGDHIIQHAARILKDACRAQDMLARIGGDEFAVLMPGGGKKEAEALISRVKSTYNKEVDEDLVLSISFGHASKETELQDMDEVFAMAENNMNRNKMFENASTRSQAINIIMHSLFEKSNRELLHSRRVSTYAERIAQELGLDDDQVNAVRIAGLIHDIGKIGVDECILNKEGKLTDVEWKDIKKHPVAGWRILSSVKELSELAEFVLAHHEQWSGGGYPNGLKGEAIPLESRIIAIADGYDVMTSTQSYRSPLDSDQAREELENCAGDQYDPRLVEVFVQKVLRTE